MAKQQPAGRKESRSNRDKQPSAEPDQRQNGHGEDGANYERELAGYLQERIKPGLSSSAIPLLARSIAKEIARWDQSNGAGANDDVEGEQASEAEGEETAEALDSPSADAEDEQLDDAEDEQADDAEDEQVDESEAPPDFEGEMHEFQAELGEDWILSFSVQGEQAWLTAEKDDGSQRVEAPNASVLSEVVELLNEDGGRST